MPTAHGEGSGQSVLLKPAPLSKAPSEHLELPPSLPTLSRLHLPNSNPSKLLGQRERGREETEHEMEGSLLEPLRPPHPHPYPQGGPTWRQTLLLLWTAPRRTSWPGARTCRGPGGPTAAGSQCSSPDTPGPAASGSPGTTAGCHTPHPAGAVRDACAERRGQSSLAHTSSALMPHKF